ncbi:hypothetical protein CEXT_581581 [Caerostris extrusa]|uniref:Uncharacterized protein n=1 Tax=Caerostris extrusa TaxID=172846 RepID=A0AAV4MWZ8_CAEEX|nr:hypothetical protein CEXT_581581 [Caerostris extrusa]
MGNVSSNAGEKNFGSMDYPRQYSNSRHKRAVYWLKQTSSLAQSTNSTKSHSSHFFRNGRVVVTLLQVYCEEGHFQPPALQKAVFFRMQAEFRSSASSRVRAIGRIHSLEGEQEGETRLSS